MKNLLIVGIILTSHAISAQELSFNPSASNGRIENTVTHTGPVYTFTTSDQLLDIPGELNKIDINAIRRHTLGDEVAKRMHLFEQTYTYMSNPLPGSFAGKLVIQKPEIYNGIQKLGKIVARQEKKGIISREQAISDLSRYLDVALLLFYEDTAAFEEELKKTSGDDALVGLFQRVKLI
ncbi:MAG: hypothetical protein JXQ80_03220 [Bacteroidales bacterium]|nr:hypothetical protein [Bacteroidales bacterium]